MAKIEKIEEGRENDKLTLLGKAIKDLIPEDVSAFITLKDSKGMVHILQVKDDYEIEQMLVASANRALPVLQALSNIFATVIMNHDSDSDC